MDEQQKEPQNPLEGCPEKLLPVCQGLEKTFSDAGPAFYFFADEAVVTVGPEDVLKVLEYLKETLTFDYLVDVGGLHDPGSEHEFMVFYNLLSISKSLRIRVKTWTDVNTAVPSVTGLWEAANWHERETWDMFGIKFNGHPDHRRMFLPENVTIHPLRKDYPLRGDNDKPTW